MKGYLKTVFQVAFHITGMQGHIQIQIIWQTTACVSLLTHPTLYFTTLASLLDGFYKTSKHHRAL